MLRSFALLAIVSLLLPFSGCTTLQEIAALSQVKFSLEGTSNGQLAGVDLSRIQSYNQLSALDLLRFTNAVRTGELPLTFTLDVGALNPESNAVSAQLVKFDWTLLVDDAETISGSYDNAVTMPPGTPVTLPLSIRLDLIDFFGSNLPDLIELAKAIAGEEGSTSRIKLVATPTVSTPVGPITYPGRITVVNQGFGS